MSPSDKRPSLRRMHPTNIGDRVQQANEFVGSLRRSRFLSLVLVQCCHTSGIVVQSSSGKSSVESLSRDCALAK